MTRWRLEGRFDGEIAQARAEVPGGTMVPASVIKAVIAVESGFNPDAYLDEAGGDGSVGLMQIRPSVARGVGYHGTKENLFLPPINVHYGTALLVQLANRLKVGETGDWAAVFSAYNGGVRPRLGFGARVTRPTTVCLRKDPATGKCLKAFTAQPGQFGNEQHVDRALQALSYFGGGREATKGGGTPVGMILLAAAIGMLGFLLRKGG